MYHYFLHDDIVKLSLDLHVMTMYVTWEYNYMTKIFGIIPFSEVELRSYGGAIYM